MKKVRSGDGKIIACLKQAEADVKFAELVCSIGINTATSCSWLHLHPDGWIDSSVTWPPQA